MDEWLAELWNDPDERWVPVLSDRVAAQTLRRARHRAGLSQRELARRAGVAQSVVGVYEAARRQPSLPALADLVEALGQELLVAVEPLPEALAVLRGPVGRHVRRLRRPLLGLAEAQGCTPVAVVGPVATGEDGRDSPCELFVTALGVGAFELDALRADVEGLLGIRVRLTTSGPHGPHVWLE